MYGLPRACSTHPHPNLNLALELAHCAHLHTHTHEASDIAAALGVDVQVLVKANIDWYPQIKPGSKLRAQTDLKVPYVETSGVSTPADKTIGSVPPVPSALLVRPLPLAYPSFGASMDSDLGQPPTASLALASLGKGDEGRNGSEDYDKAIKYMNKLKAWFHEQGTYQLFIDLMNAFQRDQKDLNQVREGAGLGNRGGVPRN